MGVVKLEMILRTGFLQSGHLVNAGAEGAAQDEFASADETITLAKLVFVKWHSRLAGCDSKEMRSASSNQFILRIFSMKGKRGCQEIPRDYVMLRPVWW